MFILARELRGFKQPDLAKQLDISQGYLSKIETGLTVPSEDVIQRYSEILQYPVKFFYRPGYTKHTELYYRKRSRLSPKMVYAAEAEMNLHRFTVQELLKSVDVISEDVPVFDVDQFGSPEHIAREVRKTWRLKNGAIHNLTGLLETKGIIVLFVGFPSQEMDGRHMITDSNHPIIFVNNLLPVDRQRFTIAHELGHFLMHSRCSVPELRDIELEANKFASEFMIPVADLQRQIPSRGLTFVLLQDLKRYWRMSMAAILYQANASKLISEYSYKSLVIFMSKNGMKKNEPVTLDKADEKPILFPRLIEMHLNDLAFGLDEFADLLCLRKDEVLEKYLVNDSRPKLTIV